jgi:cyclin-dependent kinase-like
MNRYDLISLIGEGAYGSVYKARRKANNEIVAIKKFKDNTDNSSNKNIKRTVIREIKMLRNLKHPTYVVSLQDQFKRKGRVHLVFEYIDKSLLDLLESHPAGLNPKGQFFYIFF